MSLFRKPPDCLLEISDRVYVFNCCLSNDVMGGDEYTLYLDGVVSELEYDFPEASSSVLVSNFGEQRSQLSDVLSHYNITVMNYPCHYKSCPLLPLEIIHHFLKLSESWLSYSSYEGERKVLLLHCERGAWPLLAFMLSGLLLYRKQYQSEEKTLELVYRQAPVELLHLSSPLNPQPSQQRYLEYISRRKLDSDCLPVATPLLLDCLVLRDLPHFEGCRPILRVYGQDPSNRSILVFSTPKTHLYQQEECKVVKLDIKCRVRGDVVLECIHLHDDLVREEMVFRIMFHTGFVRGNVLMVQRDEMDVLWDAMDQFPKEFKAEVHFSGTVPPPTMCRGTPIPPPAPGSGGLGASPPPPPKRAAVDLKGTQRKCGLLRPMYGPPPPPPPPLIRRGASPPPPIPPMKPGNPPPPPPPPGYRWPRVPPPPMLRLKPAIVWVFEIELERACNIEIMLTNLHMPLPDMIDALLAMDDTVLDLDQIDNLIKFCPTEEEMEPLKHYTGHKLALDDIEQYFLELMKVPRVESKLRVFSFKIQFGPMITEFKKRLSTVNSACEEVFASQNLKEVMKEIIYLEDTINVETTSAAAVGFQLDSFIKLSDTHSTNSNMTLVHYLCKDLAHKVPVLLDFYKDLESLDSASKICLKSLAEEMQAIVKGLDKLNQELTASESDGPVSEVFCKALKEFIPIVETEVAAVLSLFSATEKNADELSRYFGEDPARCSFEQVTRTLMSFIRSFKKAHEENIKQEELEKKEKATKEVEMKKDSTS